MPGMVVPGAPLITVAVPSFNQGHYLADALASIFAQRLPVEVFVADGGSTDQSIKIIQQFEPRLAGWRSHSDKGQSAAINESLAKGRAPYVCWLNSDDMLLPGGLATLFGALEADAALPAAYGRVWNLVGGKAKKRPVWVEPFDIRRLATRCIISQPGTLIRRSAWEAVGGIDESLHMAMDYDLWWRLYRNFGKLGYVDSFVAINREHPDTKTKNNRRHHYREAMAVVRKHHGSVPLKWWLAQPYAVWLKALIR
jgi:glycosyltransferase involved in cell wall biosynthesis